jgi:hypothetical protein
MWKKYGTDGQAAYDNINRRMRIACWITKATNTHSEYVILIPFPQQQWLRINVTLYLHRLSRLFSCYRSAVSDICIIHTPEDEPTGRNTGGMILMWE